MLFLNKFLSDGLLLVPIVDYWLPRVDSWLQRVEFLGHLTGFVQDLWAIEP